MFKRLLFLSLGFSPAWLAACEAGNGGADRSFHVDELAVLSYVEEVRIGSLDDPDEAFSRIGNVAVADDGTVYVLEEPGP